MIDTATKAPLLEATRTIPIVFVSVADPVGVGLSQFGASGR
jgi:ABC-type uncharacterized transport system substrate-binding protein